jgi:hypothetical protein
MRFGSSFFYRTGLLVQRTAPVLIIGKSSFQKKCCFVNKTNPGYANVTEIDVQNSSGIHLIVRFVADKN